MNDLWGAEARRLARDDADAFRRAAELAADAPRLAREIAELRKARLSAAAERKRRILSKVFEVSA